MRNFSLFKEMIRTQKLMSPAFVAGECSLRLSVYQSSVASVDYLPSCLESKETDKSGPSERSCWCLFRLSLQGESPNSKAMHRDSYGRFAADMPNFFLISMKQQVDLVDVDACHC